jgi:hypothetical protein
VPQLPTKARPGKRGTVSNPRYAHEFDPSRKGLCKRVVGSSICGLAVDAPVHQRWVEAHEPHQVSEPENSLSYYRRLQHAEAALAAEREAHERTKAALSARDSFSAFAALHPKELAEALTNEAREQAREAEAALARADALVRCVKRVVRQMTHRLDTMTATGEDFTEADVKRWRDKLAAYLRERKGGAAAPGDVGDIGTITLYREGGAS